MATPLVKVLSEAASAEAVRQELIDAGVPAGAIAMQAQGDEAGAMKGNFVNGDFEPGRGAGSYDDSFRDVVHGGVCVMIVTVGDETLCARAREIFAQHPSPPGLSGMQ